MTLQEKKAILENYLVMKVHDQDWHAVSDAANDIREIVTAMKFTPTAQPPMPQTTAPFVSAVVAPQSLGDITPTASAIPHHENRVTSLLRLNDNDLVNALFPEQA